MRLYATIEAERGGRQAKKGDDKQLTITLYRGNAEIGLLTMSENQVTLEVQDAYDTSWSADSENMITFTLPRRLWLTDTDKK